MSQSVTIEFDGSSHSVPEGITVIQAMWHLGRPMIRGVGCLNGVCGACTITMRSSRQIESRTALACQTTVEESMSFTFLPPDASKKALTPLSTDLPDKNKLIHFYPETRRCVTCGACTTICPQGIDVMGGVRAAINGDITAVAEKFTSCVMCGLCSMVCDARIRPHRVGIYARRLSVSAHSGSAEQLYTRIDEINTGRYAEEWERVMSS
jgi:succinate dehydrogenase/fumarate reductase-like Fe-S protein